MTENSANLNRGRSLVNEKVVTLQEGFDEYVTIGVDPLSFKPVVRICNTDGISTTYVSLPASCFSLFVPFLREAVNDDGWSLDMLNRSGVTVLILDGICHLQSEYDKVTISTDAASLIAYEKTMEIHKIAKQYYEEYCRYKQSLKKYRLMEYLKYFPNGFDHLKACTDIPILNKYFGIE